MDLDEFRTILSKSRADVWTLIDAAISVASLDYGDEMKDRRDGIIERLYASSSAPPLCRNCDVTKPDGVATDKTSIRRDNSSATPRSNRNNDDDEKDEEEPYPYTELFEDEQTKILRIKDELEDPNQSDDAVVELLQTLADMDITFKGLQETDIGRHVNQLRKHEFEDVRILVKHLVRKWKEIVDDWVANPAEFTSSSTRIADGDSPQQNTKRSFQNDRHLVPDFASSPNPHNGSSGSERNYSEPDLKTKSVSRRENPIKPAHVPPPNRPHKESTIDPEKLASASKRLQENYKEAQNAKKQRKIQVMDIHEIPKPKNGFISKNKGAFQGRHHR
jgi:hypothetical protein